MQYTSSVATAASKCQKSSARLYSARGACVMTKAAKYATKVRQRWLRRLAEAVPSRSSADAVASAALFKV